MTVFRFIICMVLALICAAPSFAQQKSFLIANESKPTVAIVIDPDATIAEQTAAKELSIYLKKITGGDFLTYQIGSSPSGMPRILVGQSEEARKLLGNIDWKTLKFDGISIKFVGNDLVLAGDRPRGSLYAVYTFLEEYLGCRWWTAKASRVPYNVNLSVKKVNKTHIPPFMYRETYYQPVIHKNLEFASKLKLNGTHQSVPVEYGGHYNLLGFVHTADRFLPASVYFDKHPEWYSLVNGKRIGGQAGGQLCLTNEEMKAEFVKQTLNVIATDPSAGMIAIDQNDNFSYCQCDNCNAVAKEEGGQTGVLIRFVNAIADEVAKKYPDFLVETLAYQYTRHAPKLARPRDNVIVRLCSIECDFASPLDSKNNASFYKDLQDWKKMAKHLYIWDYVVDFANLSIGHPNWRTLAPNIRIFADNNVVGMFEQGDGFNSDAAFGNMKIWVMSQLMWDKSLDAHKLMKEFATGYYGPAAPYMINYLDLTCDAVEKSKMLLGCFVGANFDYLKQPEMDKANALFDKAELAVSNNAELLKRVRIERLALDHTWILQTLLNRSKVGKARNMDMKAVAENFISMSESTGNNYIGESSPMTEDYYNTLRSFAVLPPLPAAKKNAIQPAAVKGLKAKQWVEMQDGKMNLYMAGVRSFIVADEEASDGRAVKMLGKDLDWSTQMHLDRTGTKAGEKITVYVSVKAKLKATSGVAFTTGIYDTINGKRIIDKTVRIEDVKDSNYHEYNLGTYKLEPGWYTYVAPPGDENLVEEVLVDRGFVIKSK